MDDDEIWNLPDLDAIDWDGLNRVNMLLEQPTGVEVGQPLPGLVEPLPLVGEEVDPQPIAGEVNPQQLAGEKEEQLVRQEEELHVDRSGGLEGILLHGPVLPHAVDVPVVLHATQPCTAAAAGVLGAAARPSNVVMPRREEERLPTVEDLQQLAVLHQQQQLAVLHQQQQLAVLHQQ
ncbi:hypothetical protein PVAP13_1KG386710 [Panicum virgatum]|uniref:Uncharacterized protein n=1 Tax=Panicum virgatum TaxID=38727 RepID=A0A8T0XXF7_PANVG|nr:hypothetical protein PVAP13_1KG386710 [Panicum virgatum]